jgi:hypothetical protein
VGHVARRRALGSGGRRTLCSRRRWRRRGRRWRGHGVAARSRGRHGRRGRRRKEQQRVEIALRVGGLAHPQMDVRRGQLPLACGIDRPDQVAFGNDNASSDGDGPEVYERHRVSVRRLDRHRLSGDGHGAGKHHRSGGRRNDGCADRGADVDPTVLPRRVRVRVIEGERRQDRAGDGPAPAQRRSRGEKHCDARENDQPFDGGNLRCQECKLEATVARTAGSCQNWIQRCYKELR